MQQRAAKNNILTFLTTTMIPKLEELKLGKVAYAQKQADVKKNFIQPLFNLDSQPQVMIAPVLEKTVGSNAVILDEKIYPLIATTHHSDSDLIVYVHNNYFCLAKSCQFLHEVELLFMGKLTLMVQNQILHESHERLEILTEIEMTEQEIAAYLQINLPTKENQNYIYQNSEWGVFQQDKNFCVYIEVPSYVVEDKDGTLYRFDATQVGLILENDNSKDTLKFGKAKVLTTYEHMFVPSKTKKEQNICMVKDSSYYGNLNRMSLADAICMYLFDAKRTLMSGHFDGNCNSPHHSISSFIRRQISRQDAEQRNLPIYSYYR
ncbi:MAG: hypothetical protein B6242_12015 [Anaerolineaceae bacterium 4572_78]|nr:MAG: hypothetical protein B6242_12015 [Anaerolineaceae bacterium 4572_78]